MRTSLRIICVLAFVVTTQIRSQQPAKVVDFRSDIQPILAKNCMAATRAEPRRLTCGWTRPRAVTGQHLR